MVYLDGQDPRRNPAQSAAAGTQVRLATVCSFCEIDSSPHHLKMTRDSRR